MYKFSAPSLSPLILHRKLLVEQFQEIVLGPANAEREVLPPYKLVLLLAAAGYGKTTLLADFARQSPIPCCWCILDDADSDQRAFLGLLLSSIQLHFPRFGAKFGPFWREAIQEKFNYSNSAIPLIELFIDAIAVEITEPFAIVLCNYQKVHENPVINQVMQFLLHHLPKKCVILIESRVVPKLDLTALIMQGQVYTFGNKDLKFTAQEIRQLSQLQGRYSLTDSQAKQLAHSFDGWITGILLSTHLSNTPTLAASFPSSKDQTTIIPKNREGLFVSLVKELFQQKREMYAFLKEAAILQQMEPSICNALLEITNASELLQLLEQQGLFVTHREEGMDVIYICHPVFQEVLCAELRRQTPERFILLHQRAAELFYSHHKYEQTIYHALEVGMVDLVERIILERHSSMFAQGDTALLASWIDKLLLLGEPSHMEILLVRAKLYLILGEYTQTTSLLDKISAELGKQAPEKRKENVPLLQARIDVLRSRILFQQGNYIRAQELCRHVLAENGGDDPVLASEALTRLGVCANLLGNFSAGITYLQQALQLWGRSTKMRQVAELHSTLASTYSLIGNFALANHHSLRANEYWNSSEDKWGKVDHLIRVGLIEQRQGAFPEAEALFVQALTISRDPPLFRRGEAYALVSLAELCIEREQYEQSLAFCEDSLALVQQLNDEYLITYTHNIQALAYLFMKDTDTALLLLSSSSPKEIAGYEYAIHELTRGTILLYQRCYTEAYACLSLVENSFRSMDLKREQVQVTLRLAACALAQQKMNEVIVRLGGLIWPLAQQYGQLIRTELHRFLELANFVQRNPQAAHLRIFLTGDNARADKSPDEPPALVSSNKTVPASNPPEQKQLSIFALGNPQILLEGNPFTNWRVTRALELCFFLLDCKRPVHREQIICALWSSQEGQLEQSLRTTIYHLRKVLGEKCITYQAGTYALSLESIYDNTQIWYDVAAFQQHYANARQALERSDENREQKELLIAFKLYKGDYLQSFYNDWCLWRRSELSRMYHDILERLARLAWKREEFEESAVYWQAMLARDNCLEEAHLELMRCYLRMGKRGLALRQYQLCADILQKELLVTPGPELQNLYQGITSSS